MGLFSKKKKSKERNEIANKQYKELLANTALETLVQGQDYEELAYTTCEFGYLFMIEDHGFEALYKIITDKGTFYFAAQKGSVMRLDISEEMFRDVTETFLSMHG